MSLVRTVGWLFAIVVSTIPCFWLMIHPRADYWRARRRSPYRVLVPVWMLMWLVAGAVTWPWRHLQLYDLPLLWIPAVLLFAVAIFLYARSREHFGGPHLSGRVELEPERFQQGLVTAGIRQRVRHPVYLAHLCELVGWSLGTGMAVICGLSVFGIVTGIFMVRVEERELEARFGDAYRAYRQRVPAILPRLFTRPPSEASRAL